jgi:hypothetical protein
MEKPITESTPASERFKAIGPAIERIVDQATTATRGPLLRALAHAEIGAAKRLSKAATRLQTAARRLEAAGRTLASREANGNGASVDNDIGEDMVSPHLA